jgi:hypothetical protein
MTETTLCTAGECTRRAVSGGLCAGHRKRKQRLQSMGTLRPAQGGVLGAKDQHVRLKDCALDFANAIEDADYEREWENLVDAAEWVALGVPKTPRLQKLGYRLLKELRTVMRQALQGHAAPRPA